MSTNATSNPNQLRNLAFIIAGVSFALASLYFVSDAVTDWAIGMQAQYPSDSIPMGPFSNMVRGFAISTGAVPWLIGCTLVGVALLVTAIIKTKRSNKSASVA